MVTAEADQFRHAEGSVLHRYKPVVLVGGWCYLVDVDENATEYDVFVQGTVFLDIVLTGMCSAPVTGTEIFAEGMGSCPGGVAN